MTKKQAKEIPVRIIIYKEKDKFQAVCLDLNLFGYGDTLEEARKEIEGAVAGHIRAVCENNLDEKLLFRPADKKYWDMWDEHIEQARQREARTVLRKVKAAFDMPVFCNELCHC